jgi:hypothetical protein
VTHSDTSDSTSLRQLEFSSCYNGFSSVLNVRIAQGRYLLRIWPCVGSWSRRGAQEERPRDTLGDTFGDTLGDTFGEEDPPRSFSKAQIF